jgi:hypothetical protein
MNNTMNQISKKFLVFRLLDHLMSYISTISVPPGTNTDVIELLVCFIKMDESYVTPERGIQTQYITDTETGSLW